MARRAYTYQFETVN